jgi:hypothetical protein
MRSLIPAALETLWSLGPALQRVVTHWWVCSNETEPQLAASALCPEEKEPSRAGGLRGEFRDGRSLCRAIGT